MLSTLKKLLLPMLLPGICVGLLATYTTTSYAVLTIVINEGKVAGLPISIVPFDMVGVASGQQPADVIDADLSLSGRFETIHRTNFLSFPHDVAAVKFKDWRLIKSEALVVGKVINIGNSHYEIRFRLIDVYREKELISQKLVVPANKLRKAAHVISDIIYQKITGIAGAFDTKIAYITVRGEKSNQQYLLRVADSDGWQPKTVLESHQPILSPSWSPDGSRLAYVSFEKKRSVVFTQDLKTGNRTLIAEFKGLNSAPAWSPDGKKIALTLSKDGNPEIYIYDIATADLRRLTHHAAIDTEPSWAPDGKSLIFTSGRSGKPHIYQKSVAGGPTKKLTSSGTYNAGASFSPDGRKIVLITNQGNGFKVGIYSTKDRIVRELTRSRQDESPSFAPNGDVIMYATQQDGQNVLATVSTDGQVQQILKYQGGAVREPAWSPFNLKL